MHHSKTSTASIVVTSFALLLALASAACSPNGGGTQADGGNDDEAGLAVESVEAASAFPDRLAAFGNGYPKEGDPCLRLGESDATIEWLDDSAVLVGCPSEDSAAALGGSVVAEIEGIFVVSVPTGNANAGLSESGSGGDALVAGTEYHATAEVQCGFDRAEPASRCQAGVKRNWGEGGETLVEISKPDGGTRAIYFAGSTPVGANSAESDGSASWEFETARDGDQVTITFGPETYVIVDALVLGG